MKFLIGLGLLSVLLLSGCLGDSKKGGSGGSNLEDQINVSDTDYIKKKGFPFIDLKFISSPEDYKYQRPDETSINSHLHSLKVASYNHYHPSTQTSGYVSNPAEDPYLFNALNYASEKVSYMFADSPAQIENMIHLGISPIRNVPIAGWPMLWKKDEAGNFVYHFESDEDFDRLVCRQEIRKWWNGLKEYSYTGADGISRPLTDFVHYLYPLDEPYLHTIKVGIPNDITYKWLQDFARIIKEETTDEDHPNGRQLIEALTVGTTKDTSRRIPPEIDIIGFDCYKSLLECGDNGIHDLMAKLEAKAEPKDPNDPLYGKQRFYVIPEAWFNSLKETYIESNENHAKNIDNYVYDMQIRLKTFWEISINDPRIEFFMPFSWTNVNDGKNEIIGAYDILTPFPGYNAIYAGDTSQSKRSIAEMIALFNQQAKSQTIRMPKSDYGDLYKPIGKVETVTYKKLSDAIDQKPDQYIWGQLSYNKIINPDIEQNYIIGWASEPDQPHLQTYLKIIARGTINGVETVRNLGSKWITNVRRPDVNMKKAKASGVHGFAIPIEEITALNEFDGFVDINIYAVNHNSGLASCEYVGCHASTDGYIDQDRDVKIGTLTGNINSGSWSLK